MKLNSIPRDLVETKPEIFSTMVHFFSFPFHFRAAMKATETKRLIVPFFFNFPYFLECLFYLKNDKLFNFEIKASDDSFHLL